MGIVAGDPAIRPTPIGAAINTTPSTADTSDEESPA
jgi:hypothetical protein